MQVPKLFTKKMVSLNDNPKSAPVENWNKPPDPRPSITFDSSQLPAVADWKVGETYMLEVKVELIESRLDKSTRGDRTISRFIITHVGVENENKEKSEPIDMNQYNQ